MKRFLTAMLLVAGTLQIAQADDSMGYTVFVRGAVTAQKFGGAIRLLGADAPLYEGDTLSTAKKSFVVINLEDGTRMVLRPNTMFKFEEFEPEKNRAVMRLFRGGLRALTGFISKRNTSGFRIRAGVATIGIRGTKFDLRVCGDDCKREAAKYSSAATPRSRVVGRVALMKGTLNITGTNQRTRPAVKGAPLYEGDKLATGTHSFALLALRDEGRFTLLSNTEFSIKNLVFNAQRPDDGNAVFELVRGGIRAFTGLIGKRNRRAYKVLTTVATIGIRGTGFDLVCQGTCVDGDFTAVTKIPTFQRLLDMVITPAQAALPQGDGLFAHVWAGKIVVELDDGPLTLDEGNTVFIRNRHTEPQPVSGPPPSIDDDLAPRPDTIDIDFTNLFATVPLSGYEPGLFVNVIDGHVTVDTDDGQHTDLGDGEAAMMGEDDGKLVRLAAPPRILLDDPYFKTINEDFMTFYDLLGDNFDDEFECTIQ